MAVVLFLIPALTARIFHGNLLKKFGRGVNFEIINAPGRRAGEEERLIT